MSDIKLKYGLSADIPEQEDGSLLVTIDDNQLYLDIEGERHQLTSQNISSGAAAGSVSTENSNAIAENSFAVGNNTVAGSKAFKILALSYLQDISLSEYGITGLPIAEDIVPAGFYILNTVEGLQAGMACTPFFEKSRGSIEFIGIVDAESNRIVTVNFDPEAVLYEGEDADSNKYNYLTIVGHPTLGDIDIGASASAQGESTIAQGTASYAGGSGSIATGQAAFAMGTGAVAAADSSVAMGEGSVANGWASFSGGINSYALGGASFAYGENAVASKIDSKALGMGCHALGENQFVTGKFNKLDPENKYVFIVGNGWHDGNRSDAIKVDWEGNAFVTGDVYTDSLEGQKLEGRRLVTKAELDLATMGDLTNLTWDKVQEIVRGGYAPIFFPIGYEFEVKSGYSDKTTYTFQVVAHDYLKSAEDENAPTMTLMSKNVFGNWSYEFDASEKNSGAEYFTTGDFPPVYCDQPIVQNHAYYHIFDSEEGSTTGGAVAISFWTFKDIPAGKYLARTMWDSMGNDFSLDFIIFDDADPTTSKYMALKDFADSYTLYYSMDDIPEWILNGTKLEAGIVGAVIKYPEDSGDRYHRGSNNYKESAIRQFINSNEKTWGNWWERQTIFDNPPSYIRSEGFLVRFSKDFLDVVGTVNLPCSGNGIYEDNEENLYAYTLQDKFYLPSYIEVAGFYSDTSAVDDGSKRLPYFEDTSDVDRVKQNIYKDYGNSWWMLRTPHDTVYSIKAITDTGSIGVLPANTKCSFSIMCTIV